MLIREPNTKGVGASKKKSMLGRIEILVYGNSSSLPVGLVGYIFIANVLLTSSVNRISRIYFSIRNNRIS